MKKILSTVSAVVLSLAMVAMPSVAMADDTESTETVTETVTTETVTEPGTTEPETTAPETTGPEVAQSQSRVVASSKPENTGPPEDLLCTDITDGSYSAKVDAGANDPFSVAIPAGKTLIAYCVKAGTEPIIIDSNDDAPNDGTLPFVGPGNFVIDHPNKDSVSHYQLKLIDTVVEDVCDNIDDVQSEVPDGYVLAENGTSCIPVDDVCDNIDDVQTVVPDGYMLAENGTSCIPVDDECDDLTGARGFSISVDEECPDLPLEVSGTPTHQVCEESGDESVGTYVQGSIQLTVDDLDGVVKIEYSKDGGSSTEVDLTTLKIENLAPGKYDFVVTVADGYEAVDNFSVTVKADNDPACKKQEICHWNEGGQGEEGSFNVIDVSIKSIINVPNGHEYHENDVIPPFDYYDDEDNLVSFPGLNWNPEDEGCGDGPDLPTEGPVIPEVKFTPGTCEADGSYQLISPAESEDVPAGTVTWFVNDVETAEGTYPLAAGVEVTVKVVANFVDYPVDIDGTILTEYTYDPYSFTVPTDCDLDTLALTGSSDTTPALALTAFLGLLGLAMVRSGIRVNRVRQEA